VAYWSQQSACQLDRDAAIRECVTSDDSRDAQLLGLRTTATPRLRYAIAAEPKP
jgi:hypothetical protein